MFIWDSATAFVLVLALAYFGSFAWIEIRDRRNRKKALASGRELVLQQTIEQVETAAPPTRTAGRRRSRMYGSN
jgi:hypothetical protein